MKKALLAVSIIFFLVMSLGQAAGSDINQALGQDLGASLRVPQETICQDEIIVEFVLTNIFDQDIKIFQRWNSWGAYNWRFEGKDEKGRVISFSNPQQKWTKNGPSTQIIKSGESFVLKSHLWFDNSKLEQAWEYDHDPKNKLATFLPVSRANVNDLKGKLSIRGIYSNINNEETIEPPPFIKEAWQGVWQGTITTDWYEVVIDECN